MQYIELKKRIKRDVAPLRKDQTGASRRWAGYPIIKQALKSFANTKVGTEPNDYELMALIGCRYIVKSVAKV